MIEKRIGNLFDNVKSGYIVHCCNDQGKMGAGFALELKNKYPNVYNAYVKAFRKDEGGFVMGEVVPYVAGAVECPKKGEFLTVFNLIGQHLYFGHPDAEPGQTKFVSYDALVTGLNTVNWFLNTRPKDEDTTLHFPLMGAFRAGGDWDIIEKIIDKTITHPKVLWVLE